MTKETKLLHLIREIVNQCGTWTELDPLYRRVLSNIPTPIPEHPVVDVPKACDVYIKGLVRRVLKETDDYDIPQWVCYSTGVGPRRWQKIHAFTAPELRQAAATYAINEAGNRRMKRLFLFMAEEMERRAVRDAGQVMDSARKFLSESRKEKVAS